VNTAAAQGLTAFVNEPPLSPTMAGGEIAAPISSLRVAQTAPPPAAPTPAAPAPEPTPIAASSIETLLLRFRLVTPDQIAHAMSQQMATGKTVATIVQENGWVSDEDLQKVLAHANPEAEPTPAVVTEIREEEVVELHAPAAAPEPEPEFFAAVAPAPAPEPEFVPAFASQPAPEPTPVPAATAAEANAGFKVEVLLHLVNGERLAVATFGSAAEAKAHAQELTRDFAQSTDWPQIGGRLIRPESIVSVDLGLTGF
jgi:hypothetical protein